VATPRPHLIFCGEFELERLRPDPMCAAYGWQVRAVDRHELLPRMFPEPLEMAGVFLDLTQAPERELEILRDARRTVPDAPLVACVRFSDALDWDVLMDSGAYSCLHRPLAEGEFRQTLGFLSDHYKKRLAQWHDRNTAAQAARREAIVQLPRHARRRHHARGGAA
jgi:DNA-binding NtrC family response regulator